MVVVVVSHAVAASVALLLGAVNLTRRRKGDHLHRSAGRVWVVAMYWVIISSFAIHQLSPGHFTIFHALSVLTFTTLTVGLWAAVRGRIDTHRGMMTGSYFGLLGAFIGAVAVPSRDVPQLAVHHFWTFVAAVAGCMALAALAIGVALLPMRRPARPQVASHVE